MFEQLKKLKQLNDLKNSLQYEKSAVEKKGIRVVVNGKMEIEEIKLNFELSQERQEKIIKDCVNEAMKNVQFAAAKKMMEKTGFNF